MVLGIKSIKLHLKSFLKKIPVPRVFYHPSHFRRVNPKEYDSGKWHSDTGMWFYCMGQLQGISLNKVLDTMSVQELDHIAEQLKAFLARMASITSKKLGSVSGGPYHNFFFPPHLGPRRTFDSVGEFNDHFREMLLLACTEEVTESVISCFPRNARICFVHGDLHPGNIIVDGSTITGIVDWAYAGFYPDYWEYSLMHYLGMPSGWEHIVGRVFPGERREREIYGVQRLRQIMTNTFLV